MTHQPAITKTAMQQARYRTLDGDRTPVLTRMHFRRLMQRATTRSQTQRLWDWADTQDDADRYFDIIDAELKRRAMAQMN